MVDAPPAGPCQVRQPGAGAEQEVDRGRPLAGHRGGLLGAGPPDRLRGTGRQRVVDGAEQGGAGRGQGDDVVLARRAGRCLRRGLGAARDGVGQRGQRRGTVGAGAQQPLGQGVVETVHGGQGLVEAGDLLREQTSAHHAAARAGGNHCISGNGVVTGSSSR